MKLKELADEIDTYVMDIKCFQESLLSSLLEDDALGLKLPGKILTQLKWANLIRETAQDIEDLASMLRFPENFKPKKKKVAAKKKRK